MTAAVVIKIVSAIVGLVLDVVGIFESAGVEVNASEVLAGAAARLKKRSVDLSGAKLDMLDILDGTKPLDPKL